MKYLLYGFLASAFLTAAASCEKKYEKVMKDETYNSSKAYIKFVHASPNFRAVHNHPDTFNVFVNNSKINATILTYNAIFPFSVNSTTNTFTATYAAVEPGLRNIRLSVPGKAITNTDSAVVFNMDKTLEGGKFYTFLITDSINRERDSSKIFVEDQFKDLKVRDGYVNFRFINAAMNDTAGRTVNLSSFARNATMFTNVRPGQVSGFAQYGFNISAPDTLYVRRYIPNSTLDTGRVLAKLYLNSTLVGGSNPLQRSITVYYKGDANLTSGTKARSIGAYIND